MVNNAGIAKEGILATFPNIVPTITFLLSDNVNAIAVQTITIDGGINC